VIKNLMFNVNELTSKILLNVKLRLECLLKMLIYRFLMKWKCHVS